MLDCLPEEDVLSTVPFRFKGVNSCDAIVAMPISYNFSNEMLGCMETSFGTKAFDLFGIPAFSKRLKQESQTVLNTLSFAIEDHHVDNIFLFQHVDFHENGRSNRFINRTEEDLYHKNGLMESRKVILKKYPNVEVFMTYARIVNKQKEIELLEILPSGKLRVRLVAPYRGACGCDTAVVMCMDFRFRKESRACVRLSLGKESFAMIGFPGASKRFLEHSKSAWKAVKIACERYGCKKIIGIHHADCGAYGGTSSFIDKYNEEIFHYGELTKLREEILKEYAHVEFVPVYVRLIENDTKIQFVRYLD